MSCLASEDVRRPARLDKHLRRRLVRARYEAEDAELRDRVDPENRLVARSLERPGKVELQAERPVRDDRERFLRDQPPQLSPEERARIAALSVDLPVLWHPRARPNGIPGRPSGTWWTRSRTTANRWASRPTSQVPSPSGKRSSGPSDEQPGDLDKLIDRIAAPRHEGVAAASIADILDRQGTRGIIAPEMVRFPAGLVTPNQLEDG